MLMQFLDVLLLFFSLSLLFSCACFPQYFSAATSLSAAHTPLCNSIAISPPGRFPSSPSPLTLQRCHLMAKMTVCCVQA